MHQLETQFVPALLLLNCFQLVSFSLRVTVL